jgi:hypothetical protein
MSAGTDVRAGGNFLQYLTLQMVLTVGCCWFRIAERAGDNAVTSPFIQQIADNRVCQVLTCLPEKFVVDFANGIDVAQEHTGYSQT